MNSPDKALLNVRCKFSGVIVDKQNLRDTYKGKCLIWESEMFSEFATHKKFESTRTVYAELRWTVQQTVCWLTQSTAGLGNKLELKSWLLPFFLMCIRCQRVFCFQFCNLPHLNKCCCTLTVWLGLWGHCKSHFWDHVLCQLPGKYHWSVSQFVSFS